MIKYQLAAIALKAFSINDATKVAYRKIGNAFGAGRKLNEPYLRASAERGELLVELTQKYGMLTEGSRVLEIGTGWMHWFSVYLRLFREAEFVTYDVWDNRQFQALQGAMAKLKVMLKTSGADSNALLNIEIVQACKSFDELYRRFGMTYVVEPGGSLSMFSDASFDVVMSFHVMEHVYADAVPAVCKGLTRALKPGGYMVITTPNIYRIRNVVRLLRGRDIFCNWDLPERGRGLGHITEFSADRLGWQAERAGLTVLAVEHVQLTLKGSTLATCIGKAMALPLSLRPRWRDGLI